MAADIGKSKLNFPGVCDPHSRLWCDRAASNQLNFPTAKTNDLHQNDANEDVAGFASSALGAYVAWDCSSSSQNRLQTACKNQCAHASLTNTEAFLRHVRQNQTSDSAITAGGTEDMFDNVGFRAARPQTWESYLIVKVL
jgi:hypothetical protein